MDWILLFNITDWIAAVLVVVAAVLMLKIAKITGSFTAWNILSASFFLIALRRIIAAYALYSERMIELGYINSVLQFILSVMFVVGFYKLYIIFKMQDRTQRVATKKGANQIKGIKRRRSKKRR